VAKTKKASRKKTVTARKKVTKDRKTTKTKPAAKKTAGKAVAKKKSPSRSNSPSRPKASSQPKACSQPKTPARKTSATAQEDQSKDTVTVDRRTSGGRRNVRDRRVEDVPVTVERRKLQRREKVNRRRQIDPTTCERNYTADEIEFMNALDDYKRVSGRMFPTCSEVLEVIRNLGYEKHPKTKTADRPAPEDLACGPHCEQGLETSAL